MQILIPRRVPVSNKISYLLLGIVVPVAIMIGLVLVFTRAEPASVPEDQDKVFSKQDISEIRTQTGNLENYGNLPSTVSQDEIGRDNPFDSY